MNAGLYLGVIFALFAAGTGAEEPKVIPAVPKGPPSAAPAKAEYFWKAKTIYRFQYQKIVAVTRVSESDAKPTPRTTEFNGVLVLDVESVGEDGMATAVLRFDNPRILMAPLPVLDVEKGQVDTTKDYNQVLSLAMNETLREIRWKVTVSKDGTVAVLGRTPEKLGDVLQKISTAGSWRKKVMQDLFTFMENHLKLGASGRDEELFFRTGSSAASPAPAEGFDALRPLRALGAAKGKEEDRIELPSERVMPKTAEPDKPIEISNLDPDEPPIFMVPGKVENSAGQAVFDAKLGMLDKAAEKYMVNMTLRIEAKKNRLEVAQQVQVEYRLTRLAPAIRTNEPAEDAQP
ncbi:MAG: hypothetical protein HY291_23495 [Planctomycetes bacterium]|nr:hypothetical protein [Planctomycetota bacterium]